MIPTKKRNRGNIFIFWIKKNPNMQNIIIPISIQWIKCKRFCKSASSMQIISFINGSVFSGKDNENLIKKPPIKNLLF